MKRITALVLSVSVGASPRLWGYGSGSGDADSGAAFLRINPSVRGEALGGLNPASAPGTAGMNVNPASLAMVTGSELTSGFAMMLGESQYGNAGYGTARGRGAVGASVTFLRSGQLQGRDSSGNPTADFEAQDLAAGLTAATTLGETFRVGITGKAVRQEIANFKSKTAFAADAGVIFETGTIGWGAAALNVGSGIEFEGVKKSLPTTYSLGASVPLGGGMTGLIGVSQTLGETAANMGLEYDLRPLSLRVGYRSGSGTSLASKSQKTTEQALGGLTGGIGISAGSFRIDYAISQTAVEWGMGHRASVGFKWGGEPSVEEPVRRERRAKPAKAARPAPRSAPAKTYEPREQVNPSVTTGSRRAYDPAPIKKKKKRWVY